MPSGRIPQAKPGRSRILYRKPVPRQGDRVEHKPKKKKRGPVRSLALRPPVSSTAGSVAQGLPFPLGFLYRKPVPRQGDRVEHKPKKKKRGPVRSLALRPPVSSTAGSVAQGLPFPLGFISHSLGERNPKEKRCGHVP